MNGGSTDKILGYFFLSVMPASAGMTKKKQYPKILSVEPSNSDVEI
jgi:hypothetical protein